MGGRGRLTGEAILDLEVVEQGAATSNGNVVDAAALEVVGAVGKGAVRHLADDSLTGSHLLDNVVTRMSDNARHTQSSH